MTQTAIPPTDTAGTKVPANNGFPAGILIGVIVTLSIVAIIFGTGVATRLAALPLGPVESRTFAQSFDGATSASVSVQFGAGQLTVGALDSGDANLATVNFSGPSRYMPEQTYRVRAGVGELAYLIRGDLLPLVGSDQARARMDVHLALKTPLALAVEAGGAESVLDLAALKVTRLDLQTGATKTTVRLPQAAGQTSVSAHGGVTDLTFEVPAGVAADIQVMDGPASRQIDVRRFPRITGGHYRSPEYETTANRIDLQVELGMASLTIR